MTKSAKAAKNSKVLARIDEWNTRFAHESGERLRVLREPLSKRGEVGTYLFKLYQQECAKLSKETLTMKLSDFIATMAQEKPPGKSVTGGGPVKLKDEEMATVDASRYPRRTTRANGGREPGATAIRPPVAKAALGTTAKRPPKGKNVLVANTPMGPMRLPSMITPKVRNGDDLNYRALKPEEVAFSVTGTPVFAADPTNDDAQHIAQMLLADEEQLTPDTRNVVQGLKTVIRKMHDNPWTGQL